MKIRARVTLKTRFSQVLKPLWKMEFYTLKLTGIHFGKRFSTCKGGIAERYSSYFYEFCLSKDENGDYQIIIRDLEGFKGALQTVPEYAALSTGMMPRPVARKFSDQIYNSEAMQRIIKEKKTWKCFQDNPS